MRTGERVTLWRRLLYGVMIVAVVTLSVVIVVMYTSDHGRHVGNDVIGVPPNVTWPPQNPTPDFTP